MKLADPNAHPQNGVTYNDLLIAADYQSIDAVRRMEQIAEERAWDKMLTYDYDSDKEIPYTERIKKTESDRDGITSEYTEKHIVNPITGRYYEYQEQLAQKEAIIKSILLDDDVLYNQGWRKISRNEMPSSIGQGRRNQIIFRNIHNEEQVWVIGIKCEVVDKATLRSKDYQYRRIIMQQLGYYAGLPLDENRRVTIATESTGLFNKFIEYEGCSYKGQLSVMLMDLERFQVTEERLIANY